MNCTNVIFDNERGTLICLDTGEVIEENSIVLSPEWRAYTPEEWSQKAHASTITHKVHDSGLSTEIDISVKKYREAIKSRKLALLQRKTRVDKTERKIVEALTYLNQMATLTTLPNRVIETAAIILKKIFNAIQPRTDKLKTLALASLVIAARKHEIPVRIRELLAKFNVDEEEYWKFISDIYFKVNISEFKAYIDPRKYLPSIIANLNLSQKAYLLAAKMIEIMRKEGLTEGKDPAGIAAACVYIASILTDEKKTQKQVAEAANVTEVTIRNRYRDIIDKLNITIYL
jgi:transcription initiation factor TFIIB